MKTREQTVGLIEKLFKCYGASDNPEMRKQIKIMIATCCIVLDDRQMSKDAAHHLRCIDTGVSYKQTKYSEFLKANGNS